MYPRPGTIIMMYKIPHIFVFVQTLNYRWPECLMNKIDYNVCVFQA